MPESSNHTTLVRLMAEWMNELLPPMDHGHLFIDVPEHPPQKKPPNLYGHVPDILVVNTSLYACVIGEAKTATDIDNEHTVQQLIAFLRKCAEHDNSLLVMAVPWNVARLARWVIAYCKRQACLPNIETKVIDGLPG